MRVLMVCLGNICRSPLAEGVLRQKVKNAGLDWVVDSAGTNRYHIGEPPHVLSQKVAQMNGIDICNQRARRFAASDFEKYDKIYAMALDVTEEMKDIAGKKYDPSKVSLLMSEVYETESVDVPDPWSGPMEDYIEAYELIDEACGKIIEKALMNNNSLNA